MSVFDLLTFCEFWAPQRFCCLVRIFPIYQLQTKSRTDNYTYCIYFYFHLLLDSLLFTTLIHHTQTTEPLKEVHDDVYQWIIIRNRYWFVCVQAQLEAQKATQDFQRATEVLRAAKETISLAEQRLLEEDNRQFDSAWQEMLNHATQRVSWGRSSLGLIQNFYSTCYLGWQHWVFIHWLQWLIIGCHRWWRQSTVRQEVSCYTRRRRPNIPQRLAAWSNWRKNWNARSASPSKILYVLFTHVEGWNMVTWLSHAEEYVGSITE